MLQLPREVLVHILLVEVRHRLSSCILVHSTWAAAALAAADSIHTGWRVEYDVDGLLDWLEEHGGERVTSLWFFVAELQEVSHIPCSRLRDLEVRWGELRELHPADFEYPNMVQTTIGLMHLVPGGDTLACSDRSLSILSALTDLQHLELRQVGLPGTYKDDKDETSVGTSAPIPGSLFSQLVKLTHLELGAGVEGLKQETFQPLGCLTALQHLGLSCMHIDWVEGGWVHASEGLDLSRLTQLTCLDVQDSMATFSQDSTPLLTPNQTSSSCACLGWMPSTPL